MNAYRNNISISITNIVIRCLSVFTGSLMCDGEAQASHCSAAVIPYLRERHSGCGNSSVLLIFLFKLAAHFQL